MRARFLAVLLIAFLAAPALAGCLGATSDGLGDPRAVKAESRAFLGETGWAYDGRGALVDAKMDATFNDADDSGSAVVSFALGGETWRIAFDQFAEAPGKAFMDGGVAFDLVEHGDSGVADASVPKLTALVAAWGEATVTVDGTPIPDANTGGPTWTAHVMVSDTRVRDASGRITKADGATPYDPAAPADARREEGARQLLFALKPHARDASSAPYRANESAEVAGQDARAFTLPAGYGGRISIVVASAGVGGPVGAGQFAAVLKDPDGTEIGSASGSYAPGAPVDAAIEAVAAVAGEYTLEVAATGAFAYTAAIAVESPPDTFLTLTWDDFEIS